MQRRRLLSHWTQTAALMAWQQMFAAGVGAQPTDVPAWSTSEKVFTLGVASGEPRADSVVLWTRLAPRPRDADGGMPARSVPVEWQVATDERFTRIVRSGVDVAGPDNAHSVHVEVTDLAPGRHYFFRFTAGGQRSETGRTRTAPSRFERNKLLRFALASCQHYEAGYFTAHRDIAAQDIDLVIFAGDYTYENRMPGYVRRRAHSHEFPDDPRQFTLTDYRQHHAGYKLDADLRACHAAHPWLLVWDDHDVINDYAGDTSIDLPDKAAFLRMRAMAYRAYFEHLPISPRRAPVGPLMRMHEHYQWGQLAGFWTLDGRQHRDGRVCSGVHAPRRQVVWRCPEVEAEGRSMLGSAQEYWLADGLAASESAWKFIAQPTQIAPVELPTPMGPLKYADGWDAFSAARRRLMSAIAQPRVPDVICLSGDVHRHVAANLRFEPSDHRSAIIASEFATTSLTPPGMSELLNGWAKSANPDLLHMRSDERGYALFEVTPLSVTCDFKATAHPVRPDSRFRTQARYAVERGVPGPRRI